MSKDIDTSQEKFNNSGLVTTAKPISSQTDKEFPLPDPAGGDRSRFDSSRFDSESHSDGKDEEMDQ